MKSNKHVLFPRSNRQQQSLLMWDSGGVAIVDTLTPTYAAELLARLHPGQRALRPAHVNAIAKAMQEGRFKWLGDPLRFDEFDQLIDGQHRLAACVQANVTLHKVLFVRVAGVDAIQYIDVTNAPRSIRDVQRVRGGKIVPATVIAAVCLEFCDFDLQQTRLLTKPERVELVDECPYAVDLTRLYEIGNHKCGVTVGPIAGALRCLHANYAAALAFFAATLSNSGLIDGIPCSQARVLADYLLSQRYRRSGRQSRGALRGDPVTDAYKTVVAYNAWREGREIHKLQRKDGAVPPAAT